MSLYQHVQPLFLGGWSTDDLRGNRLRVRLLDNDTPDPQGRFLFWTVFHARDPKVDTPKMLIEMSPDGEGWTAHSTVKPRERPYIVPMPYILPFVRARIESAGEEIRGYALVLGNVPFELVGPPVTRITGRPTPPAPPTKPGGGGVP